MGRVRVDGASGRQPGRSRPVRRSAILDAGEDFARLLNFGAMREARSQIATVTGQAPVGQGVQQLGLIGRKHAARLKPIDQRGAAGSLGVERRIDELFAGDELKLQRQRPDEQIAIGAGPAQVELLEAKTRRRAAQFTAPAEISQN